MAYEDIDKLVSGKSVGRADVFRHTTENSNNDDMKRRSPERDTIQNEQEIAEQL